MFAAGLRGARIVQIRRHARDFVAQDSVGLRPFALQLFAALRERSVGLTLVSGAPQEILDALCARYEISSAFGTVFATREGVYLGTVETNRALREGKQKVVDSLKERPLHIELAVGDSESDLPLLSAARVAVVVGANSFQTHLEDSVSLLSDTVDISSVIERLAR